MATASSDSAQPPPRRRLHLPPRTARLRLSMLHAALFLGLGTVLILAIVLAARGSSLVVHSSATAVPTPATKRIPVVPVVPKVVLSQLQSGVVAQHNADLGRVVGVSWLVLVLATLGACVLGWLAAGRMLRPLRAMTEKARTISAGNLDQRLAYEGPQDEFKALADTLDELLGRLETSFASQRRFVSNASHELRTPLTAQRTLLQVALANPAADTATLRRTCEELLGLQEDQEHLIDALLTLATSERGITRREPCDLAAITTRALQVRRPGIAALGLATEIALEPAATSGDPVLLQRLVSNLIDNAVDHNHAGGLVSIHTAFEGTEALLRISNTGEKIPPQDTARLFEPYERLQGTRLGAGGHQGLGLSIVEAIATAHGARISALAHAEGGLEISVRFPGLQ